MLPIESDSSVAELDSSTLQAALSAISENKKVQPINIFVKYYLLFVRLPTKLSKVHG